MTALTPDDYRLLVESVEDYAIFMLDPEGRILSWNRGAERITGYAAGEIVGQHCARFYPEEDVAREKPARELVEAEKNGRHEDEGWRVRKDGTRFWANVVLTALRTPGGALRGFAKVTRDLTARRDAEEELRQAEQRFHGLIDAVTDYAVFMLDPEGRVATWNAGAKKAKGYSASEIIGEHFSRFYTDEDRAAGRPERMLETVRGEGRVEDEGWRVCKDGSRFWANVIMTALRDERGEIIGFATVTRDLSAQRKIEDELRRSEERFRLLVETVGDYAIYMLDPTGRVTTWNRGAERMKGYGADEIIGKSFELFFQEEDRREGKPRRELEVARAEGRFEDEGVRVRKDGTTFWANVIVTSMVDAHGNHLGFSKVTRDLTARREAEAIQRELVRAEAARDAAESVAAEAREASRIKDEFLATVSHELRTPLNAIVGWAKMLRQRELDPTIARGIEVIDRNADAQVKLIDDILDVSRIITGKLRLEPRPIDLVAIAREALEVVRPSAFAKHIELKLTHDSDTCFLVGDHDRLRQVAWNLLSNAVKFTDSGVIAVHVGTKDGQAFLRVRDTGRGIAPSFLPQVFDRFKQEEGSTTRRIGGLGLGLSLVRNIVELHGGTVQAESEGQGRGSTFTIVLPVRTGPSLPAVAPDSGRAANSNDRLGELRVLVVDDDPDARDLVRVVLENAGAIVTVAASAEEAFTAVKDAPPHVLVSDIGMPEMDGYALMSRIRGLEPAVALPSIALTAYTRAEDRTKALAAGFTTHIGKPVNPEDLITAVANLTPFTRVRS